MTDPYAELLALTEREHELVIAGAWEGLAAVDAERRALVAVMPARAPSGAARKALRRAADVQAATTALLAPQVAELRRSLSHLAQGRTAVQGYGGGGAGQRPDAPAHLDLAG
jgi:hypothetical protein